MVEGGWREAGRKAGVDNVPVLQKPFENHFYWYKSHERVFYLSGAVSVTVQMYSGSHEI